LEAHVDNFRCFCQHLLGFDLTDAFDNCNCADRSDIEDFVVRARAL
jgi:hypothetical protein